MPMRGATAPPPPGYATDLGVYSQIIGVWSLPKFGEKSVSFLVKTFFFWSSPEWIVTWIVKYIHPPGFRDP